MKCASHPCLHYLGKHEGLQDVELQNHIEHKVGFKHRSILVKTLLKHSFFQLLVAVTEKRLALSLADQLWSQPNESSPEVLTVDDWVHR